MALNIEQLLTLADRLDKEGQHDEADKIGDMVKKLATSMVTEKDPEFEKAYKKEHGSKPGAYYVGKPDESVRPSDELMPTPEKQEEPLLDDEMKSKLSKLTDEGWHIFGPGDLEKWMEQQGEYTKAPPELPGVQLTEKDLQEEEGEPEGLPGLLVPEEKEASAEDQELNLLPHQPGALDLESPHRVGGGPEQMKEELKADLITFLENPSDEAGETIQSKISEYMKQQEEEADIGTASELQEAEKAKGIPPGAWGAKKELFEKLAGVADRLDKLGAVDEAGLIDGFIQKHADDVLDYKGEDEKGEQSKRYDDKHHHSLQVREPKTEQERVDREGRDKHHIDTMQSVEAGALNTRYCPEHIGVMVGRVGELTYQCPIDGNVFNWETGWTDHDGKEHPGGSVAAQTPDSSGYSIPHRIFDSRENISNRVN